MRKSPFNSNKRNPLSPITDEDIQKEKDQHPENESKFTENTNLDAYIDMIEDKGNKEVLEKDVEIEKLNTKLLTAQNKITELNKEISNLKNELKKNNVETLNKKISDLDRKNDELILKNSELEFDVNKYKASVKELTKQLDEHKKTYTKAKYNPTPNERHNFKVMKEYPKSNGYESWN